MKHNILSLIILLSSLIGANAQEIFSEGFESCGTPPGWTVQSTVGDTAWTFGDNTLGTPGGSIDGSCMAYFHDDDYGNGSPALIIDLNTPVWDLAAYDTAELHFDYMFQTLGAVFSVALWDGVAWDTVWTINTNPPCVGQFHPGCDPEHATINITDYLNADFQAKFIYDDQNIWDWYVALDNVAIYIPPSDDAVAQEVIAPVNSCGMTTTETVSFSVYNNGTNDISSFDASYSIDGGTAVTETFSVSIPSAGTDTVTFSVPADLSLNGTYGFQIWLNMTGDLDPTNDTLEFNVESIPVITSLPYFQDFESGTGGWTVGGGSITWELGLPTNAFIDTAYSGVNAWVTNLSGQYALNELSYVESPCFDFSGLLIDPILEFAQIFNTEQCCDEGYVDLSIDAGVTWARLGLAGEGTNWYNDAFNNDWDGNSGDSTVWRLASHLLDGTAGQGSVKIRIGFSSDFSIVAEGFGFDDISITEQPPINLGVVEVLAPTTGCGLGTETVTIAVHNFGNLDLVNYTIGYNGGSGDVTQVVTDTLQWGETDTISFITGLDLSVTGNYTVLTWTDILGEGDPSNDSMSVQLTSVPVIAGIPYLQDFESGNGGWYAEMEGDEGIWEFGDPEGFDIDTAYSGVNAWASNLGSINYPNGMLSYLYSPCIDLSAETDDPIISFAIIFDTEFNYDAAWLEASIDGGISWSMVGTVGEGENWYTNDNFFNFGIDEGFAGQSGIGIEWLEAETILENVAGSANVRLRFAFASDGSVNGFEGVAIDDISIHPQPQFDLAVVALADPSNNCDLGLEPVSVRYVNKGLMTLTSYDVGYTLNGNTITETSTIVVAQGDTATYTFSQPTDLSTPGDHDFTAFTALVNDEVIDNDTITGNIVTNFVNTPPAQSNTEDVNFTGGEGAISTSLFFCGLPTSLDNCYSIDRVTIDGLTHDWMSDLDITLVSPVGDSVLLSSGAGCCVGGNLLDVSFQAGVGNDILLQQNGIAPGIYDPVDGQAWADLHNGQDPNGEWQLVVNDPFLGDDGILTGWTMSFANNDPIPELNMDDSTICINHVIDLSATPGMDSYLWNTLDNTQTLTLNGADLGIGTHQFSVSVDFAGCTGQSDTITITVDECVGIEESNALVARIFPNPSSGLLTIEFAEGANISSIEILEASGRVVLSESVIEGSIRKTLDLAEMPAGVYGVRLSSDEQNSTSRFVIQK